MFDDGALDRSGGHPAYRQLADRIRKAILDGRLSPAERLPSERDLQGQYAVSRDGVRRALGLLRAEGWIEVHPGSGYTVRDEAPAEGIELLLGIDEDERGVFMYRHAQDWGLLEPTRIAWERPSLDVARRLGVDPGDEVVVRDRLIGPPGGPLRQLATTYLPGDLARTYPRLAEVVTGPKGFIGVLEDVGMRLAFALTIAARMPLPDELRAFQLGQGQTILRLIRTTHQADTDRVVEVTDYRLPGARFEVTIPLDDRRRPRPPVEQDLAD